MTTYIKSLPESWGELTQLAKHAEDLANFAATGTTDCSTLANRIRTRAAFVLARFAAATDREVETWQREEYERQANQLTRHIRQIQKDAVTEHADLCAAQMREYATRICSLRAECSQISRLVNASHSELVLRGHLAVKQRKETIAAHLRRARRMPPEEFVQ